VLVAMNPDARQEFEIANEYAGRGHS